MLDFASVTPSSLPSRGKPFRNQVSVVSAALSIVRRITVVIAIAVAFLFGVGTTAGMMLITSLIALPFMRSQRLPALNFAMQVLAGVLSVGLGCYLAWRIGVSDGLFPAAEVMR